MRDLMAKSKPSLGSDLEKMVNLRNEIHHGLNRPHSDEEWEDLYIHQLNPILDRLLHRLLFLQHYRILYILEHQEKQVNCLVLSGVNPTP